MLQNELEMGEENHYPNEHKMNICKNQNHIKKKKNQNTCKSKESEIERARERKRKRDTCTWERWWFLSITFWARMRVWDRRRLWELREVSENEGLSKTNEGLWEREGEFISRKIWILLLLRLTSSDLHISRWSRTRVIFFVCSPHQFWTDEVTQITYITSVQNQCKHVLPRRSRTDEVNLIPFHVSHDMWPMWKGWCVLCALV